MNAGREMFIRWLKNGSDDKGGLRPPAKTNFVLGPVGSGRPSAARKGTKNISSHSRDHHFVFFSPLNVLISNLRLSKGAIEKM